MFSCILMILMAWFVSMPLWLSILIASISGLGIIVEIIKLAIKD